MSHHTLRVLTINLNGYAPYDDRQPVLRAGIERLDPDIMSFQEAAYPRGKQHQVAQCLDGLGYHLLHQFDGDPKPAKDGNCIASRWPMDRVELLPMPTTERAGQYPVAALAVRVHAPAPIGDFLFVNPKTNWQLHLELEREQQVVAIAKLVERHADPKGFPAIVAADFDAETDRSSIRFLTGRQSLDGVSTQFLDAWEIAGDGGPGFTWTCDNSFNASIIDTWLRQRNHRRRIDYIFVGSPFLFRGYARIERCRVVLNEPVNGIYASGHFGVLAEIVTVP